MEEEVVLCEKISRKRKEQNFLIEGKNRVWNVFEVCGEISVYVELISLTHNLLNYFISLS